MFKSVLSQQVNGFIFYTWQVLFIFCLFLLSPTLFFSFCSMGMSWKCTHNAQPNKLTDSCMGHSVIRWRQYHSVSSLYQDQPSQLLCLPTSVLSTRLHCWENACDMLVLDSPPSVSACNICFHSSTHNATAFRCYKGIYTAFYSIYAVLKCQMLPYFCFIFTLRIQHLILLVQAGLKKKSHLFTELFLYFFSCFVVILFRSLHKNKNCMHNNRKWAVISCEMPNKKSLET